MALQVVDELVALPSGALVVAGLDWSYATCVQSWDGAGWNSWGVRLLYAGQFFRAVVPTPRYLYLGGNFVFQPVDGNLGSTLLPGTPFSYNITRWDGTNWSTFGQGIRDIRDTTAAGPADPSDIYTNWYSYVFAIAEGKNGDVFAAGEFAMITPTGVATQKAKGIPMEYAQPKEGSVLLMVAECVTANNDSPALAQKLAEFLLTPQAQAAALEFGNQIPSNLTTKVAKKVDNIDQLLGMKKEDFKMGTRDVPACPS